MNKIKFIKGYWYKSKCGHWIPAEIDSEGSIHYYRLISPEGELLIVGGGYSKDKLFSFNQMTEDVVSQKQIERMYPLIEEIKVKQKEDSYEIY